MYVNSVAYTLKKCVNIKCKYYGIHLKVFVNVIYVCKSMEYVYTLKMLC
jgi:hypothetical protein